jgi:hypothetical protein
MTRLYIEPETEQIKIRLGVPMINVAPHSASWGMEMLILCVNRDVGYEFLRPIRESSQAIWPDF